MSDFVFVRTRGRKVWCPYTGWRWPPPRLIQLIGIARCWLTTHDWSRWRIETEDWFEYLDEPEPYAWRHCGRCMTSEHVRERG